jgi:hypothetical protein
LLDTNISLNKKNLAAAGKQGSLERRAAIDIAIRDHDGVPIFGELLDNTAPNTIGATCHERHAMLGHERS